MILITLSACNESTSQMSNISQDNTNSLQQIQTDIGEIYTSGSKEKHVSTMLSSGIEVSAIVEISDDINIEQLAIYDANIEKQDYELLKQLLFANKEIEKEESSEMADARTDALFHYCIASDGSSLAYTGAGFTYDIGQYSLIQNILHSKEINANQFIDNRDLNFSTQENAKQDVENIIKHLNIEVEKKPICYTLSFESLQSICEKLNKTRRDVFGEDSPFFTPYTCNITDACYIFIYQVTTEGLPISAYPNGILGDGSWTPGTFLLCVYSENGIVEMELPYSLQMTGQASPPAQGLNINHLLEKIDNKFNSMILNGDYTITQIEFEYVPMPINGSRSLFKLIPAWRTSVFHTYQFADEKSNGEIHSVEEEFDVVFNAITGEEILNSYGSI